MEIFNSTGDFNITADLTVWHCKTCAWSYQTLLIYCTFQHILYTVSICHGPQKTQGINHITFNHVMSTDLILISYRLSDYMEIILFEDWIVLQSDTSITPQCSASHKHFLFNYLCTDIISCVNGISTIMSPYVLDSFVLDREVQLIGVCEKCSHSDLA